VGSFVAQRERPTTLSTGCYDITDGACAMNPHKMTPRGRERMLFIHFNTIMVRDAVPVQASAHSVRLTNTGAASPRMHQAPNNNDNPPPPSGSHNGFTSDN
jgi:hypothetical protein